MMHTRRVLGVAAATATVTGLLLLPTQGAFAATPPCVVNTDPATSTMSIDVDCTQSATIPVPDGWTFDGNGRTMTVDASFTASAVIRSAPGTAGNAPPVMNVKHLTLASVPNGVDGILVDGAQGTVTSVTVQGGQDGVKADNTVGADFTTTGAQVKVGRSTISGYQHAGVYATGDLKLDVLQATIGNPSSSGQSHAGVWMDNGAHGSVKLSHIALSDAEPASDTVFGAGVRIEKDNSTLPRRIEVKRNVFTGGNADFGISVSNAFPTKKLTADTNCNLFVRHDTSSDDPYGVGVARWQNSSKTNLLVSNSTFQGNWNHDTGNVSGLTVTAGPPNTLAASTSTCPPGAPRHLRANRNAHKPHKATVSWHTAAAPVYAPLTRYRVKAKAKGHPAIIKNVGPGHTSVVLKRLGTKLAYHVTVTARSNGGKASAAVRLPRA